MNNIYLYFYVHVLEKKTQQHNKTNQQTNKPKKTTNHPNISVQVRMEESFPQQMSFFCLTL